MTRPIDGSLLDRVCILLQGENQSISSKRINEILPDLIKEMRPDTTFVYNYAYQTLFHLLACYPLVDYSILFQGKHKLLDCNINDSRLTGTPLYVACDACNSKAVNLLLNHGAISDPPESISTNPLIVLCKNIRNDKQLETLRVLINHGMNIDIEFLSSDRYPKIIINLVLFGLEHLYIYGNFPDGPKPCIFLKILLDAGANVNFVNGYGQNALHLVCGYGDMEAAKVLVEHGCDYKALTKQGKLPIDWILDINIKNQFLCLIDDMSLR